MREEKLSGGRSTDEAGFALILALLALLLLTFLGLTLAVTTSTELQIASNYRWGQAAYYNAEAGIEAAKHFLRDMDWSILLPICRGNGAQNVPVGVKNCTSGYPTTAPPPPPRTPRVGPEGEPSRNFELCSDGAGNGVPTTDPRCCDTRGGMGYGVVLDDIKQAVPFQNSSVFLGERLNGTFSLWLRRRLMFDLDALSYDDPANNVLVLTAEGTAPFTQGGSTTAFATTNRAVRYLEVTLQRQEPGDCENRTAQAGSGPTGSGFDQCDPIRAQGINPRGQAGPTTEPGGIIK